jgi:hypothetical protein
LDNLFKDEREKESMVTFPVGEKKEQFHSDEFDVESYIYFLMTDEFTGVLKIVTGQERGEVLFVDGTPFCASYNGTLGDDAIKKIIATRGTIDIYFLEKKRAAYAFHWYKVVRKNPLVSWRPTKKTEVRKEELERIKLIKSLGIENPSKKDIKKILENEGMDFLVKD